MPAPTPELAVDAVVWLVDDDGGFRDATTWLLESVGINVRPFASAESFLAAFDESVPGCVLTDLRMPGVGGLALQRQIAARSAIPIIFVSGHGGIGPAVQALKDGAVDFLEKPIDDNMLIERIQAAIRRDCARREAQAALADWRARLATLTARERDVMALAVTGKPGKQIAHALAISTKTVEAHKTKVLRKLGARSWLELCGRLPDELRRDPHTAVEGEGNPS